MGGFWDCGPDNLDSSLYSDYYWQWSSATNENSRSVTYYALTSGSTACSTCVTGAYYTGTGLTTCSRCSAGTFSTALGATAPAACVNCAAGTYSTSAGASACLPSFPGSSPLVPPPLVPGDGPCELRNLTWKVSAPLSFSTFNSSSGSNRGGGVGVYPPRDQNIRIGSSSVWSSLMVCLFAGHLREGRQSET